MNSSSEKKLTESEQILYLKRLLATLKVTFEEKINKKVEKNQNFEKQKNWDIGNVLKSTSSQGYVLKVSELGE